MASKEQTSSFAMPSDGLYSNKDVKHTPLVISSQEERAPETMREKFKRVMDMNQYNHHWLTMHVTPVMSKEYTWADTSFKFNSPNQ